ncbi:hypothetical protein CO112_03460 [Candidatus Dojkabacteria bacterium CG_4_9_14_3_um_filter_150_Dojkabacteria_WS6_41_13]|uniref:Major facilitator superfamily (MFS) profile domain-containing protein n=1 Tax=Candidatus Dojkabacteria bacterium CG_4_10_14_0_2_um_filter_Dojkabacteria_WS6_41_15 TaxID=2014249 RepID=A0A2M7W367_9BACT|nr:MAG: hypothetical protein COX64_00235 [Candidatus Dojkabacteria bacterium CG_4_10_14_0_2_um_filter_Dojkabacteria_WS6_41_15]PJB22607.1 MAG: hypothetical protein CO112_03460 [Candidatus Dojkabacteria bacterium CG_4_9_14_3_um_filter_150_Dojkabacteria_WS6_41_13]
MRNVKLLYIINALYYSWFWLGIWVLYYLKFGGFSVVGLLEVVMIVSTIIFEIPTGAIGDLLGKKKTLIIACFLAGVAQIWTGVSPSILHLVLALVLLNFGGALRSGTFEAMIYDSLKDEGKEKQYMRVVSNMGAVRLATLAVVSLVGGIMYKYGNGLPYIVNGITFLIAAVVASFLTEPRIDSEKFNLRNYIKQNVIGFKQLFINHYSALRTIGLLLVMMVTLIVWEGINDILSVKYGFTATQLGFLSSIFALAGAGGSVIAGKLSEKVDHNILYFGSLVLYILSMLVSPFVGMIVGGGTILLRNFVSPLLDNETSTIINNQVESKYRATALSSFSMLTSLPYAILIFPITASIDRFPATWVAFSLGLFLILAFAVNLFVFKRKQILSPD